MKDKLNALTESVSLSDAEKLADELASFDDDKLTDEEQQRILSSVMRKAGFEMNNTNSVITAKRNITARSTGAGEEKSAGRIQLRRGGAIAACLAILLAGGVVFSLNRNMHNTVPNNDRDSSIYNEAVTTDPEDDKESSDTERETDTEDITNESTADNNDSKKDNKKDSKTDSRNGNDPIIVVDANKENNKDNNSENKTDDSSSLKDRIHEDVQLKLIDAYPDYTVDTLNENRYILYKYEEYGDDYISDYMIYDAPSDSVINTFRSEGRLWDTLDSKFVSFSEPLDDEGYYNIIKATVFDENGNAVYKYDINAQKAGMGNNIVVSANIKFTPDGRKMIAVVQNGDDILVDKFYCIDYEDQKKAKLIAEKTSEFNTNSDGYSLAYYVSNGLMLVDRFYNDEHHEIELINLDPKSDQITEPYSIYNGMTSPWVVSTSDTIYSSFDADHYILAITTDDSGNINVGGRNCTVTRYDLGGCANLSINGLYASSAYITDNGKIKCTVYDVSDGKITKLRSKEIELTSPEYGYILSTLLNEETGDLSIYRQKDAAKHNYPNIDCKTDEVNMFR